MDGRQEWVRLVKSRPLGLRPSGFFRISAGRFSDFPEWVRFVILQNFEPRSERWLCFAESLVPVPRDQRLVWIADSWELLGAWAIPKGRCRKRRLRSLPFAVPSAIWSTGSWRD